jgi:uncharacterized protein (DUF427 family)/uncharacterized protein GlcG (DUF336 family)
VAKARELGVSENVAILDDGGNLKAFGRMDGAPIPTIEMAQNKAYTALLGVSTQEFFNFIQSDPSLLAGIPTLARMAAWGGGFPIKVSGEVVGAIGLSGAPTVQNDIDCAKAAIALVPDAASTEKKERDHNGSEGYMADKPIKVPGPDHPISIEANPSRVVVTVSGKVIADTRDALILREASYPAVQYIPRRDVDMAALTRSEHTTYCPYKGDASYYSIPAGGDRSLNAVWTYENPFEAMVQIKDYVAFYPDRVDEIS